MARRHKLAEHDAASIALRLQELIMANSGASPFDEAFRLVVAKLYDEREVERGAPVRFKLAPTAGETATNLLALCEEVCFYWPGVLASPTSTLSDTHLCACVEELVPLSLLGHRAEIADDLFEHLVSKDAKGDKGQFFTPRQVIDLAVHILRPRASDVVVDPSCGSGGFLVHAAEYMRKRSPDQAIPDEALWGFDFDSRAVRVARASLYLAGVTTPRIFELNSLLKPASEENLFRDLLAARGGDRQRGGSLLIEDVPGSPRRAGGFDILLANPPFAGEIKERHVLDAYELHDDRRRAERDVLFIERCMELLRPGGRFAIVLPDNKIASARYGAVRAWLLRRASVTACISLPRTTFLPHTHQKTSLVVGQKRQRTLHEPATDETVFFAVAERSGKDSRGQAVRTDANIFQSAWESTDHDLAPILAAYEHACTRAAGEVSR